MGCRIPIRQMPVGILFSKDFGIIGKSEFANPLKDSDIIGNCYGLPNSDSANAGRHTFSQRSPFFLANRNLPTHYRSPFFLANRNLPTHYRSTTLLANRNLPTHYRSPFFLAKKEFANSFLLFGFITLLDKLCLTTCCLVISLTTL